MVCIQTNDFLPRLSLPFRHGGFPATLPAQVQGVNADSCRNSANGGQCVFEILDLRSLQEPIQSYSNAGANSVRDFSSRSSIRHWIEKTM